MVFQLADAKLAEQFGAPVDLSEFPDYIDSVGYPTDLLTMKQRLENGFYRRVMAITWEAELIAKNAQSYNLPTAPIVANARAVTAILKYIIRYSFAHLGLSFQFLVSVLPNSRNQDLKDATGIIKKMRDNLAMQT